MIAAGDMDAVERQLAVFARVALEPDPAAMARIRSALLREARLARVLHAGTARPQLVRMAGDHRAVALRRPFRGWSGRRATGVLAAAAMSGLLLGGTVFASTRAGWPLYDTRIWLEQVTLPSDPDARLEAEIARAQARLAEATEADAAGDDRGVAAALGAYARIVDQTLAEGAAAVDGAERATLAFQHHLSVLSALQETLQAADSPAADAIANAMDRSSEAIDRLGGAQAGQPASSAKPGANSGGQQPAATPHQPASTPAARPTQPAPPEDPGTQGQGGGKPSENSSGGGRPSDAGRPPAPAGRGGGD